MLAVPGDADLVSELADLCVRDSAGDSGLRCSAVGGRWIAKLEEAVGTNVVGDSGKGEWLGLEGDAEGGCDHPDVISNGVVPLDGQAAGPVAIHSVGRVVAKWVGPSAVDREVGYDTGREGGKPQTEAERQA